MRKLQAYDTEWVELEDVRDFLKNNMWKIPNKVIEAFEEELGK